MIEERNIVVLGTAVVGLQATHYIMQHILPALKAKHNTKYHVYAINPSSEYFFRTASPRVATSTTRMPAEKIFTSVEDAFKKYSSDEFTFIQAYATGLDTTARTVAYRRSENLPEEHLPYHALVISTGTRTYHPAFSQAGDKATTLNAIKKLNAEAAAAKDIIVVGGGPTGVETASELGEFLNGKPGWFSKAPRKVKVTLITSANQLLTNLRPSIAKDAEKKLNALGVDVIYNTRVANTSEAQDGRTTVTLGDGKKLEADLYIPVYGVLPNSSWLPSSLLTETNYLKTNPSTLRVDEAGPRVYTLGDVSSASRNNIFDILGMLPVAMINLKRDLLSFNPASPKAPAPGKDRIWVPSTEATMLVPIGSGGGVGEIYGWRAPNWLAWLVKARDYAVGMSLANTVSGKSVEKEYKWKSEEVV